MFLLAALPLQSSLPSTASHEMRNTGESRSAPDPSINRLEIRLCAALNCQNDGKMTLASAGLQSHPISAGKQKRPDPD
jgi:hypothetical protein